MKNLPFIFMLVCLSLGSCTSHKTVEILDFNDSIYWFDTIQAQKEEYCFQFTYHNRGTSPLYITEAKAQCSCTVAEFSSEALAPGDSAQIDVYYQSYSQSEDINQSIMVKYFYNDQEAEKKIRIKGYVIPREIDPSTIPTLDL